MKKENMNGSVISRLRMSKIDTQIGWFSIEYYAKL